MDESRKAEKAEKENINILYEHMNKCSYETKITDQPTQSPRTDTII